MSQIAISLPDDVPPRKLWTAKEYHALFDMGLIGERTELIEGVIVQKPSQSWPHVVTMTKLRAALVTIWDFKYLIHWGPIGIGTCDDGLSVPEPDLSILTIPVREAIDRWPEPDKEVRLVIEVSDPVTSKQDLNAKARIYARAGVPEYWVADIEGRRLIVHRQPNGDTYASVVVLDETATVSPLAATLSVIAVRDLLP